jgi:hypothetical protein
MQTATEKKIMVPMEVTYKPAWLTWVASTGACLNALGIDCDLADVAAMSGYAFVMSVHKALCPSGPTVFDWGSLLPGICMLGRSVEVFQSMECCGSQIGRTDLTRAHCRAAFELVKREISEGRPAVIWGAYVPEFAAVIGLDEDKYIVKSFKECLNEEQPPIPYDAVEAPGGAYALGFPTPTGIPGGKGIDRATISHASELLNRKGCDPHYAFGLSAYDTWIAAMQAGPDKPPCNETTPFGNAYNAHCYAEAKQFARDYLIKATQRNPSIAPKLQKAVDAYKKVTSAMDKVAELFPFPPGEQFASDKNRADAIKSLRDAKAAETIAAAVLTELCETPWPKE